MKRYIYWGMFHKDTHSLLLIMEKGLLLRLSAWMYFAINFTRTEDAKYNVKSFFISVLTNHFPDHCNFYDRFQAVLIWAHLFILISLSRFCPSLSKVDMPVEGPLVSIEFESDILCELACQSVDFVCLFLLFSFFPPTFSLFYSIFLFSTFSFFL